MPVYVWKYNIHDASLGLHCHPPPEEGLHTPGKYCFESRVFPTTDSLRNVNTISKHSTMNIYAVIFLECDRTEEWYIL